MPQPPILMAVPGTQAGPPDPDAAKRDAYARLAAFYEDLIRTPALDEDARASLVRQQRHAQQLAGLPALALARAR